MNSSDTPVLVIGAGPAGLAFAYECKKLGIPCLVLESGHRPAENWTKMPTNLKLLSPWYQNSLFESRHHLSDFYRLVSARAFAEYLAEGSIKHKLPVITGQAVRRVHQEDKSWVVEASRTFKSKILVNATGYYSCPFIPKFSGADNTQIHQIHFAQYRDPACTEVLLNKKQARILIVGQRISAGQAAMELARAGHQVCLSCRSAITFSRPLWMQILVSPFYFAFEDWIVKKRPFWKEDSRPAMDGGESERWISQGRLLIKPQITEIRENSVVFNDKKEAPYDLIIYATGFRPSLGHLKSLELQLDSQGMPRTFSFESTQYPNLYFLGLDGLQNFRSRYLRGIRKDASLLAANILNRLKSATLS